MSHPTRLSQRAAAMPASPIRRLAPYAVAARAKGLEVHGLNIGQPDIPTPEAILKKLAAPPMPATSATGAPWPTTS